MGQQFFVNILLGQGVIVAFGRIVAFTRPAAADEDAIHAVQKGSEDEQRINPAGAHQADHLDLLYF
ncbi:hypothetical protein DESC_580046 [Desulfosarcina cetonica]|nr:hypothetical protein DESC_580046 [Desulfosarcina cetonica]